MLWLVFGLFFDLFLSMGSSLLSSAFAELNFLLRSNHDVRVNSRREKRSPFLFPTVNSSSRLVLRTLASLLRPLLSLPSSSLCERGHKEQPYP